MAPLPMTLNDFESHVSCLKPLTPILREMSRICLHKNRKTYVACNFNCLL